MKSARIVLILVIVSPLFMLLGAPRAVAQTCDKKAEKESLDLFEEGKRAYRLQQYEKAIGLFTKAYEMCGNPVLLLNIGLAHKFLGDYKNAVAFYKSYLKEHPNAPS